MAGDVDDVPALGLFKDVAQPVASHPVLQYPYVCGLPRGGDPWMSRTSDCRSRRRFSALPLPSGRLNSPSTRSRSPTGAAAATELPVSMTSVTSCTAIGLR